MVNLPWGCNLNLSKLKFTTSFHSLNLLSAGCKAYNELSKRLYKEEDYDIYK